MKNEKIMMLDVAYYLIKNYNYQQIKMSNNDRDTWLINVHDVKYPVIRLTENNLNDYKQDKDEIMQTALKISNVFNNETTLLSIHFTDDDRDLFFEPNYYQGVVNETTVSPIIKAEFANIQSALLPQTESYHVELKKRESRFIDYHKALLSSRNRNKVKKLKDRINVTTIIALINTLVFAAIWFVSSKTNQTFGAIYFGALYKPLVYVSFEWWRLIASAFVHVDFIHIFVNMVAFLSIGTFVERVYGYKALLIIYFTSILTGSLFALVQMDANTISFGASGGVYGLMGAMVVYLFSSGLYKIRKFRQPIVQSLLMNLFISFLPNVSWQAHLGGFVGGMIATLFFTKAPIVKQTILSAYLSLALLISGMFTFAFFVDDSLKTMNDDLNIVIIYNYAYIGHEKHAYKLMNDFNNYANEMGEK